MQQQQQVNKDIKLVHHLSLIKSAVSLRSFRENIFTQFEELLEEIVCKSCVC